MTTFASDTFGSADGTELQTHDANWTEHGSVSGGAAVCDGSNRARQSNSAASIYYRDEAPASADYSVQFDYVRTGATGAHGIYAAARIATGAETLYIFGTNGPSIWAFRAVAGTYVQVGSTTSEVLGVGTSPALKLDVATSGSDCILTCTINGVAKAGSPITDTSPITAAGKAGIWFQDQSATKTIRMENFSADEAAGGGGATIPVLYYHQMAQAAQGA